ncbi:hypothetical protein [Marinovum sp.]|uniref:hypothetical protein n=1 Tax=Marinovum sp. TaxID=2024839 RepID=UPI002B26B652|nr:hypothetical protein [Marinovum sp.]
MAATTRQVVTVVIRRLQPEAKPAVQAGIARLRTAARQYPGYLGAEDSYLPTTERHVDMVTIFSFDSRRNLKRWEIAPIRRQLIAEVDRHCLEVSDRAAFDGLSPLLPDSAKISKPATVAVLIVLILALGWLADLLLPAFPQPWRTVLTVTVNVCLISYLFLPWSVRALAALRKRLFS